MKNISICDNRYDENPALGLEEILLNLRNNYNYERMAFRINLNSSQSLFLIYYL